MRFVRLHRAYPSPLGIVHWVPVLSYIKTATGENRIDSCNFELCLQGWLFITNNSTTFKDGLDNCHKMSDYHLVNA